MSIHRYARLALPLIAIILLAGCSSGQYDKFGYSAIEKDGRLYVFPSNSQAHQQYKRTGDMGKSVTRVGGGPGGMTIIGPDDETLDAYLKG